MTCLPCSSVKLTESEKGFRCKQGTCLFWKQNLFRLHEQRDMLDRNAAQTLMCMNIPTVT